MGFDSKNNLAVFFKSSLELVLVIRLCLYWIIRYNTEIRLHGNYTRSECSFIFFVYFLRNKYDWDVLSKIHLISSVQREGKISLSSRESLVKIPDVVYLSFVKRRFICNSARFSVFLAVRFGADV